MRRSRVKFYSEHDSGSGWNLQKAKEILRAWDCSYDEEDINEILNYYNIKRYFDANLRLKDWDESTITVLKDKCKAIPGLLGRYFAKISDFNLITVYKEVDREYLEDFWQLICDYKVYEKISATVTNQLLNEKESALWYILHQKKLALKFGQVLADHLAANGQAAEWLMSHFLAAQDHPTKLLYFPEEYTQEMRNQTLTSYIEQDDPNPNYLRLLAQAQSSKEFPINDRLRLKARKKDEALLDKHFSSNPGMPFGVQIAFKAIPDGSTEETIEEHICCYYYSREWVQEHQDYPTLLNNFIHLFEFVDKCFRCNFTSSFSELGVFERFLGIRGKRDYPVGIAFNLKHMRSVLQMQAYRFELQKTGLEIENIFKWFFNVYLKEEFNAVGFTYTPPSEGTTYAEKCKLLAISIDGVLKQYRLFCEDGYVDRELLEMSSGHIIFSNLQSLRNKKYAYSGKQEFINEQNLLYSDQSMMTYTEKTQSRYKTLPQMLIQENLQVGDFQDYQKGNLQWLIDRGAIYLDGNDILSINRFRSFVLLDLFKNEVVCPLYYDVALQKKLDELADSGDIVYENTLFSRPEQDYLNYILNKSEFSNGLDLRNKYSHDTCSLDEKTQAQDYLELLCIMVLIIIKINEEFCGREE